MGRFPELTPVHRMQPSPIPGAGDITPRSEWTSSSTASIRGWVNGEVATNGEATILAVACGLESSETSMSVGSSKANSAGFLKGLSEIGFGAKGMDGGVELTELVFALAETGDVGGESPIAQLV